MDILDGYAHFAVRRFRWSLNDIRESWDNEFFALVRLEEDALKREEAEYKKQTKGHTGGGSSYSSQGSRKNVKHIPEPEMENDPAMEEAFEALMGNTE